MKTPMQELIKHLENWMLNEKEVQQNPTKYDYRDVKQANQLLKIKEQFLEMYKSMLEKEKEVMCEWAEAYENRDDANVGTVEECYDAYFNL